ncbi:hypothetical protein OAG71_02075 [bacterium]|nr:hypothetical protein [bacterium]
MFLILGPFVVIPYLIIRPVQFTLSAAWRKPPVWAWRFAVLISVLVSIIVTCPSSPIFVGLNAPIPIDMNDLTSLVNQQILFVNAALIASVICLPVCAVSTIHSFVTNKEKLGNHIERENDDVHV